MSQAVITSERVIAMGDQAGCPVTPEFIVVRQCSEAATGGFAATEGVVLCYNQISRQAEVDAALHHELIHAYDFCRGRNLDFSNLDHHACSEVRMVGCVRSAFH